ncbi:MULTISPECIES: hypothetical protein [unclassified Bacillus (in: firmicutes)]|uniref:hypothetical protein n=1 Tax=unclassified Bacillus (in: firmicutes) TaxID=185979 RepID=UPI00111419D1|nr:MULTISPECIES: hypothetical protein [unclassified Bacillus (in: firmicutes)]
MIVKDTRIEQTGNGYGNYAFMKMDLCNYLMTPSFVFLNSQITAIGSSFEMKDYLVNEIIKKGCTTIVTVVEIDYEYEIVQKVKKATISLINSPLDFVICIKIPVKLLTVNLLRICKKEKIPAIFVKLEERDSFENLPWGWLREAIFPYNAPLIPVVNGKSERLNKQILTRWCKVVHTEKMPALSVEIKENEPLSIPILNKIGLYPSKASLIQGSELSYNLFLKNRETIQQHLEHNDLILQESLLVTVHKGKVIRYGEEVIYNPGCGEHVKITTPSFFAIP